MIHKQKLKNAFAFVLSLIMANGVFDALAAEKIMLKIPLPWPERTSWHREMQTAVGQLDLHVNASVQFTDIDTLPDVPELLAFGMPRPGVTEKDFTRFCRILEPPLRASFERDGYTLLGLHDLGPALAFSTRPIQTPEDLKKSRLWAPTPRSAKVLRMLGIASPVQLPAEEVGRALREGTIDTVLVPPVAIIVGRWNKSLKHGLALPLFRVGGVLAVSKDGMDRLSSPDRVAVKAALGAAFAAAAADHISKSAETMDLLHQPAAGMMLFTPQGDTLKAWNGWAKDFTEQAMRNGTVPRELMQRLQDSALAGTPSETPNPENGQ